MPTDESREICLVVDGVAARVSARNSVFKTVLTRIDRKIQFARAAEKRYATDKSRRDHKQENKSLMSKLEERSNANKRAIF